MGLDYSLVLRVLSQPVEITDTQVNLIDLLKRFSNRSLVAKRVDQTFIEMSKIPSPQAQPASLRGKRESKS